MQPTQIPPVVLSRQFQSSNKQNEGSSSLPPKSLPSNIQYLWIGAAVALIIGGGAYIMNNSMGERSVNSLPEAPEKASPLKKREFPNGTMFKIIFMIKLKSSMHLP